MESQVKSKKNRTIIYTNTSKEKNRLKVCLKKMADEYCDNPYNLEKMEEIVKKLDDLSNETYEAPKEENVNKTDRFSKYKMNEETNKVDTDCAPANNTKQGRITFDDFVHCNEAADDSEKVKTVEDAMEEIVASLEDNRVILVQGPTGCGKTTQIPKLLLNKYNRIVCTQPRRIAAISMAERVSAELECVVGSTVGYSVRFENKLSPKTRLKFSTDGMLMTELCSMSNYNLESQDKIADYDLIVIDEAHERTVNIDFLLGYIKTAFQCNKNIKTRLLIMSATFHVESLLRYFNDCPLISIYQKPFPIDYFYLKMPLNDYLNASIDIVKNIVSIYSDGDILVFLTGQTEIEKAHTILSDMFEPREVSILKLYSSMPPKEQSLIFQGNKRKIILSTNVAETSITIKNVKFVVDSGKVKVNRYSTESTIDFLEIMDISKAQAKQRAGRAGRTQPGLVFRMYTHEKYTFLPDSPVPEILRSNLSSTVLSMKSLGIFDIFTFDYIDRPCDESLKQAQLCLYYNRLIDGDGNITKLGHKVASLPVTPEVGVSLVVANEIGCINAVSTIAGFLEFQTPFIDMRPECIHYKKYKNILKSFEHPKGDFYTYLEIFDQWMKSKFSVSFLNNNYLNVRTMQQVLNIRTQILKLFPRQKDRNLDIEKAFSSGFFMKTAKITQDRYRTTFEDTECFLHPKDALFEVKPKYVIFTEIFYSTRKYMSHALEVSLDVLQSSVNYLIDKN